MFSSTDSAKNAVDMFPQTAQTRKRLWICSHKQKNSKDIQPIVSSHVETVVLLSKLNTKQHIEVELNLDELDLTAAESKATYDEIKAYVLEKYDLKVSSLYISQVRYVLHL